jgi:hypothetical protein
MPAEIYLRFYEELNDYLPLQLRKQEFACRINGPIAVENVLQVHGVPDSEVELVLVDGKSVDLSYILEPGEHVSIYPVFESLDISGIVKIREAPLRRPRFVLTPCLYRLASALSSLGFDVRVDSGLRVIEESRILLTTDPVQLEQGHLRVYLVRNVNPAEQLKEVLSRFNLGPAALSGSTPSGNSGYE